MARVKRYGEIGAAALFVGDVDGSIGAFIKTGAGGGNEMAAGGEADDADFVAGDAPVGSLGAYERDGALSVFERQGRFAVRFFLVIWDAIFQEHSGNAFGVEPVTNLGAFEIDGEDLIAAAGKDDDSGAGVFVAFRRVDGHGRHGDVVNNVHGLAGHEIGWGADIFAAGCRVGVGRIPGPDRDLDMAIGGLPEIGLGVGAAAREKDEGGEGEWLHVGPIYPIWMGRQRIKG